MTVPIMPGPFSFLATAGQALGQIHEEKQKEQDKQRKIAQDKLNQMITLRASKLLDPSAFSSAPAMELYRILDILPISDKPTVGEQVTNIQERFLQPDQTSDIKIPLSTMGLGSDVTAQNVPVAKPTTGPRSVTDAERMVAKLPTRSSLAAENLAAGAGAQAEAAKVAAVRDEYSDTMASRAVDDAITKMGGDFGKIGSEKLPMLAELAWQTVQSDLKSQGFNVEESITRSFVGAQIAERWRKNELLNVQRQNAANGIQGTNNALYRVLQNQAAQVQDQLDTHLKTPPDIIKTIGHTKYISLMSEAKTDADKIKIMSDPKYSYYRESYAAVELFNSTTDRLQAELRGLQSNTQAVIGSNEPGMGIATGTPVLPPSALASEDVDNFVQTLMKDPSYISELNAALAAGPSQGGINQTDYNTIMASWGAAQTSQRVNKPTSIDPANRGTVGKNKIESKKGASPYYP